MQFPAQSLAQSGTGDTLTPTCTVTPTPSGPTASLPVCTPCDQSPPPTEWPSPYIEIPDFYQPPDHAKLAWIVHHPNKIGVVGGSAGATHAVVVALDTTNTNGAWPFWNAMLDPSARSCFRPNMISL